MAPQSTGRTKGRGNRIVLEKEWLDMLHSYWRQVKNGEHPRAEGQRHNLAQFGEALAKVTGRNEPFSESSLSRFLKGKQPSDEIAEAFCQYFEIPYPQLSARHVEEIEWFQIGRILRDSDQSEFRSLLVKLKALAVAEREKSQAAADLDAILDD